ncbi:hypothetical protein CLS_02900 [[Clostridium] cf. saccharolyticum K10]|nr:hypothetical protein CLS_02900 [[Clostridium] cf. saccharolyticum K10]
MKQFPLRCLEKPVQGSLKK